jgi:hypothetical protein
MVDSLIDAWHDVLTAEVAEDTHTHLERELGRRGLVFGGRALCTVLRPRLTTPAEVLAMQRRIQPLLRAFGKAYDRAITDRLPGAVRARRLGGADRRPAALWHASPTSRLDFFHVPQSGALALTEYSAETPAGAAYTDVLSDAFLDTAAMREFSRTYEVFGLPTRAGVAGAVLQAWREFSGGRAAPRIGILDWDDVPTITEFELFRAYFAAAGIEAVIEDPRRCEYRQGRLWSREADRPHLQARPDQRARRDVRHRP